MKPNNTFLKRFALPLALLILAVIIIWYFVIAPNARFNYLLDLQSSNNREITFTTSGDFGANFHTDNVLDSLAKSGSEFHVTLGDFSYDELQPETAWCDYIKGKLGNDFPFQLIAGNHESNGDDGDINKFAECLPSRILPIDGIYAKEYYFDYPAEDPLVRVILISPHLDFKGDESYQYGNTTPGGKWLMRAIETARLESIPWVLVGMHKNCIHPGRKSCEAGPDLMNLLVEKNVDVVLQAHGHIYARTKQLSCLHATNRGVPYKEECVVKSDIRNVYKKGNGTVFVTGGTSGRTLNEVHTEDGAIKYFEKFMGLDHTPTFGYVKLKISEDSLRSEFIAVEGEGFRDAFVIKK